MQSEAMLELSRRSLGGYLQQSSEPLALISMIMIHLLCQVTVTVTEGATQERAVFHGLKDRHLFPKRKEGDRPLPNCQTCSGRFDSWFVYLFQDR